MGHVPFGPEHDAHVPARGVSKALTARRLAALLAFDLVAVLVVAGLAALGLWQLHRRVGKLDLIARVEARVHAPATEAPKRDGWPAVAAATDEYRRVTATGDWLGDRTTLVQALTELGGGYWVLTPLRGRDGATVLVNRGFVPPEKRDPAGWRPLDPGPVTVTGLLRMTEPRGGFLRSNDPGADRWHSRDVAAIAAARGLEDVAPYFIDAEREPNAAGYPVAGLTVIAFANNHLVYALTWFALAAMAAAGAIYLNADVLRRRATVDL